MVFPSTPSSPFSGATHACVFFSLRHVERMLVVSIARDPCNSLVRIWRLEVDLYKASVSTSVCSIVTDRKVPYSIMKGLKMSAVPLYPAVTLATCLRRLGLEHQECVGAPSFSAVPGSTIDLDSVRMAELVLSVPLLAGTSGTAKARVTFSRQKESEFICVAVYLCMLMSVICVAASKSSCGTNHSLSTGTLVCIFHHEINTVIFYCRILKFV